MIKPCYILFVILIITAGASPLFSQDSNCGESKLQIVRDSSVNISGFGHIAAYGNYNKTYNSYRAIFLNYDRSKDSDFRAMEGSEVKIVIMVFNMSGAQLTEGEYTISGGTTGNQFAVGIETSKGTTYAASANEQDIGKVTIYKLNEQELCGEVNITDSRGMVVKGTFNVKNEEVR